jgi:Fcf2 pre-rRNA processing
LKTKGEKWFDMPAPELTDELKNDLRAIRMRDTLDPSRFYKAPDTKGIPKFFQIGTVVESPADFYSSRIPKRQRKKTIVEELLVDAEFKRYRKRKAGELFKAKHQNARYFKRKTKQAEKDAKSSGKKKKSGAGSEA